MARGIAASIANLLEDIYGVAQRADEVSADPRLLGSALAIGIVTSMIAAWLPARKRGARRSGAGAAEGQVPGAVGRREPRAPARRGGV